MASKAQWMIDRLSDLDDDGLMELAVEVEDRVSMKEDLAKSGIVHITELDDEIAEVRAMRGKFRGLSTGYSSLDNKMGGLEKGSVVLIGGETSNGKSALAANIAVNVSKDSAPVLYISLEMTRKQMLDRLDAMTNGSLSIDFMFQQDFDMSYKDLEPLIANARQSGSVELVVLDYLQYLGRGMTEQEVAKMSKEVKRIALKYEICFMVIVSLRKAGADLKNKRKWFDIETEDLMGTAAIGYDADTVLVASRKDTDNEFQEDHLYVKVLKTRNGRLDYNDRIVELDWENTRITQPWVSAAVRRSIDKLAPITLEDLPGIEE